MSEDPAEEGAGGEGQPPSPEERVLAGPGQWAVAGAGSPEQRSFTLVFLCKACEFPQTGSPFAAAWCCWSFTQPWWCGMRGAGGILSSLAPRARAEALRKGHFAPSPQDIAPTRPLPGGWQLAEDSAESSEQGCPSQ